MVEFLQHMVQIATTLYHRALHSLIAGKRTPGIKMVVKEKTVFTDSITLHFMPTCLGDDSSLSASWLSPNKLTVCSGKREDSQIIKSEGSLICTNALQPDFTK